MFCARLSPLGREERNIRRREDTWEVFIYMYVYMYRYIHKNKGQIAKMLPKTKLFKYIFGKEDLQGIFILAFLLMRNNQQKTLDLPVIHYIAACFMMQLNSFAPRTTSNCKARC